VVGAGATTINGNMICQGGSVSLAASGAINIAGNINLGPAGNLVDADSGPTTITGSISGTATAGPGVVQGLIGTYFNLPAAQDLIQPADSSNSAWLGNQTPAVTAPLIGPIDFPDIADNGFADSVGNPAYYNLGGGNNNNVEARWYGDIVIPGTGTTPVPINFATTSDDGSMLYIDGNAVVNNNNSQAATQATGIADLTPGAHTIDVEYYQGVSLASMDLQWDTTGGTNFVDIPNSAFIEPDNDLLKTGTGTLTLSNSNTYSGPTILSAGELLVNGNVLDSAITVNSGGTLGGDGSVPATTVQSGGVVTPGNSPGTLTATSLSLATGATFMEQLGGMAAGSQYDQTVIPAGGSASLGGATLNISFLGGFLPTVGQQFTLINNQSGSSVVGTFNQGSTFTFNGYVFGINYAGGAGDDVVLTELAQPKTTTTLSALTTPGAPPDSSLIGQSVTFTATVTANAPDSGSPTGTVVFEDGSTILATVPLNDGSASLSTSTLGVGVHTITADFMGDNGWLNSVGLLTQTVNRAPTTTTIATSPGSPVAGQSINFTATVSPIALGVGTPTGTVAFYVDGAQVGNSAIEVVDGVSVATFQDAGLAAGSHTIAVSYSGDPTFAVGTLVSSSVTVSPSTSPGGNSPSGPLSGLTPTPPQLTRVVLSRSRRGHSVLVVQFSEGLDPTRAMNVHNYAILHGRGGRVKILSAVYNPVAWTVTLRTKQRLNPHRQYQLKVNGSAPAGLISASGVYLDGNGTGVAGTSAVRIFK